MDRTEIQAALYARPRRPEPGGRFQKGHDRVSAGSWQMCVQAVLLLHRANPEWIRRQRVIALTATSLLAAAMAAVAFPVALFLILMIGGTLR